MVIARLGRDKKKRTVTFYGHYDVQPAMEREWTTDPFEMNAIDGYFYGRGTSDNKVRTSHLTLVQPWLVTPYSLLHAVLKETFATTLDCIIATAAAAGSTCHIPYLTADSLPYCSFTSDVLLLLTARLLVQLRASMPALDKTLEQSCYVSAGAHPGVHLCSEGDAGGGPRD